MSTENNIRIGKDTKYDKGLLVGDHCWTNDEKFIGNSTEVPLRVMSLTMDDELEPIQTDADSSLTITNRDMSRPTHIQHH